MTIGITQPVVLKHFTEGSVGARALGDTFKVPIRGETLVALDGSDVKVINLINEIDKLKMDLFGGISGLVPNLDSGDVSHDVAISPGWAADSTNAIGMYLASALLKKIDLDWVEGNNAGGLASGARSVADTPNADTVYHLFIILSIDVNAGSPVYTIDAGFDTDLNATNLLADATAFTHYRRVGSVLTDGSNNIKQFTAIETAGGGLDVIWADPDLDQDTTVGTTASLLVANVPTGIKVQARIRVWWFKSGAQPHMVVTSPDANDEAPTEGGTGPLNSGKPDAIAAAFEGELEKRTNTSGQIRVRSSDASSSFKMSTESYVDERRG